MLGRERFVNCNFCFIDAADQKIIIKTLKMALLLRLLVLFYTYK